MHVTRRDFIGGAGALAATAALAGSATAAVASETTPEAVAPASTNEPQVIACDVLVIGAGAAGMQATISAARAGADVVVIDKKEFGHCGDSGLHYSGRMTSSDFGVDGDCPEVQLEDAIIAGEYVVDQKLGREVIQAYYDDRATLMSENYGDIHFREPETGKPYITASSNRKRLWPGFTPTNMSYAARTAGAKVTDYVVATKLFADETGAVVGATALNFKTGQMYYFRAKSVILATGGDTGIWGAGTISAKYGGGAYSLTGDGHALAAPLGVEFRDLEFRSLYNGLGATAPSAASNLCIIYSYNFDTWEDAEGNKIYADVDRSELTLRRVHYDLEKLNADGKAGPNGGVFGAVEEPYSSLDLYGHTHEIWDQAVISWEKNGADLQHAELIPTFTYDYGGIVTNIKGETGVDGLYAAGECAMHSGAGYMVFRMFSSALVMGRRAGEAAAEHAKGLATVAMDPAAVAAETERVYGILENEPADAISSHELRCRVMDSAYKGSGALRSDKKCTEALAELDEEEALIPSMRVANKSRICNLEWMEALEVAHMIKMARMDTLASMTRTESRGTHLRNEYPGQDNDNWIKNVYVREVDGKPVAEVRDTVITNFPAPEGTFALGGGVLENY